MNYFWGGVGVAVAVAVVLLVTMAPPIELGNQNGKVRFSDLETECRQGPAQSRIDVTRGRLSFEGRFPEDENSADLDYVYRESGNKMELDIRSSGTVPEGETFVDDCLGQVKYVGERNRRLDPGRYLITVRHNGEKAEQTYVLVE
jgi:hypothetical protein